MKVKLSMNRCYAAFSIYCIAFLSIYTSLGMECTNKQDIIDIVTLKKQTSIENQKEYTILFENHLLHKDKNISLNSNILKELLFKAHNFLQKCSNKEELLDFPLIDGKRFIHFFIIGATLGKWTDSTFDPLWRILIENNAKINIQDNNGNTPLLDAFQSSSKDIKGTLLTCTTAYENYDPMILLLLLRNKANPTIQNKDFVSPIQLIEKFYAQNHLYTTHYKKNLIIDLIKEECNRYKNLNQL